MTLRDFLDLGLIVLDRAYKHGLSRKQIEHA